MQPMWSQYKQYKEPFSVCNFQYDTPLGQFSPGHHRNDKAKNLELRSKLGKATEILSC